MKKVLFIASLLVGCFSLASVKAESIYNSMKVQEQELSRFKCKKTLAGLSCVKVNDTLLTDAQYYCTLKLTKTDSIRI